jgi:hypothetical protein
VVGDGSESRSERGHFPIAALLLRSARTQNRPLTFLDSIGPGSRFKWHRRLLTKTPSAGEGCFGAAGFCWCGRVHLTVHMACGCISTGGWHEQLASTVVDNALVPPRAALNRACMLRQDQLPAGHCRRTRHFHKASVWL